jgi:long-chain fatty acid transport protein
MRQYAVRSAGVFLAIAMAEATPAPGQGFGVYEHDACVMGRSGTGVAAPCSASTVFFNPAGIVGMSGRNNLQVGVTIIAPRGSFTDSATGDVTESVANNIPVPTFFYTRQLNNRWAFGLGVNAPYGLISEWEPGSPGRFLAYYAELKAVYIQPTLAYAISPRVSVGAGFDIVRGSAEVRQRVDLSTQTTVVSGTTVTLGQLGIPAGTDFADANIQVSGTGTGFHFGVLAKPWDWITLGARVLTRVDLDMDGDASFTQLPTGIVLGDGAPICNPPGSPPTCPGGTPLDAVVASQFSAGKLIGQGVTTNIPLPEQIVLGLALRPIYGVTLLADYQYVNWGAFDILPFDLDSIQRTLHEGYRATSGWRGAVELEPTQKITLRAGMLRHDAAAPAQTVTPLLPEGERIEGTAGVGLRLSPRLRLDLAYQYIRQQDRRGRVTDAPEGQLPTTALNTGLYRSTAKLYGASVAFSF